MSMISRVRISALGVALKFMNFPRPVALTGAGSARTLCREIASTGVKRLLVITGQNRTRAMVEPLAAMLRSSGVEIDIFAEIEPDPDFELVLRGVDRLKSFQPDAVLAIGGGSVIDGAKTVVACHANDCHPSKLIGLWLGKRRKRPLPLYAIPTTAGTGSEVTIGAVVSDKRAKAKYPIIDPHLVPLMVALDPSLMTGLPPAITAVTGLDALTHAVEAYISTLATPETDQFARAATATIIAALPQAYGDGGNLEARERMAIASFHAGVAFTSAGVGYVHAIAHQLGGLYHVPHGLANAVVMPHVLDFSLPACAGRLAELADIAGVGTGTERERAQAFITLIRQMNAAMDIPATIAELRTEDFPKILDRAYAEAHGTYAVPRYLNRRDGISLLTKMLPA